MDLPPWLDDWVPPPCDTPLPRILTAGEARARAALAHGGPSAMLSGAAALREYGFRTVRDPVRPLVLVQPGVRTRCTPTILVRELGRPLEPAPRPGPALAPVERAVDDHVRTLRLLDDARAVVAEAVQRGHCTTGDLIEQLARTRRNGSAQFRQAVHETAGGARSAPEARAARALTRAGLGPFEQNSALVISGRRIVVDFLWRALRAVLEIDSAEHHYSRPDWQRSMDRHLVLESGGYSAVHVPPSTLVDEAAFVGRIRLWLGSRRVLRGQR